MPKLIVIYRVFIISILTTLLLNIRAQDTSDFFPHHLGDMWVYRYCWSIGVCDTIQVRVVLDSADQEGNSYVITEAHMIDPIEPPTQIFEDTNHYMIDTLNQVFRDELGGFKLRYKLGANEGDMWVVEEYGGWYEIARVEDVYEAVLFELPVTIKGIAYYGTEDISDTTLWLHNSSNILASGLGLVWIGGGDVFTETSLMGAVIDGILYGDTTMVTSISPLISGLIPENMELLQNYPNPFNSSTVVPFSLEESGYVRLSVYDIRGRLVVTLIDGGPLGQGEQAVVWNGLDTVGEEAASGVYLYRLRAGKKFSTRTMLLVR